MFLCYPALLFSWWYMIHHVDDSSCLQRFHFYRLPSFSFGGRSAALSWSTSFLWFFKAAAFGEQQLNWLISQSFCWLCKIFSNIALATTTKTKKTTKTMTTRECCSTDWRAKVFLGFATISQTLTPTRSSTFFVLQGPKECFLACLKISEFLFCALVKFVFPALIVFHSGLRVCFGKSVSDREKCCFVNKRLVLHTSSSKNQSAKRRSLSVSGQKIDWTILTASSVSFCWNFSTRLHNKLVWNREGLMVYTPSNY